MKNTKKVSTLHPFIALEHRVIDSAAFADIKHSSVRVLLAIARQLNKDNNGHLQATWSWCKRFGIKSENTLTEAIADLIAHGFLYRTKSHGASGVWAKYAVTWLPVKQTEGLFLYGFKVAAWRDWQSSDKKSSPQKLRYDHSNFCGLKDKTTAKNAGSYPAKTADYEVCCHGVHTNAAKKPAGGTSEHLASGWIHSYLIKLAERGLSAACPVVTLAKVTQ